MKFFTIVRLVTSPRERPHTLETEIKKRKIPANPLAEGSRRAYWSELALSAGLAEWAANTAERLTGHVSAAAGIDPDYAKYKRNGWFDAQPGSRAVEDFGVRGRGRNVHKAVS